MAKQVNLALLAQQPLKLKSSLNERPIIAPIASTNFKSV